MSLDEQVNNQENEIRAGDYASAGVGYTGKVEKIIKCNDYDPELMLCKGCRREKGKRKRYVINSQDFCWKVVEKV
jgi:hypothetical protein